MPVKPTDQRIFPLQSTCVLLGIIGLVAYAVSKFTSGRAVILVTAAGILGFLITLVVLARRVKRFGPMIPYARKPAGWSVPLVKYRGFGPSTGTPSQAHAFADATLIYDVLSQRSDIEGVASGARCIRLPGGDWHDA